jgi:glycosyltransferase involved in cell wall biosynthesis
MKPLPLVSVSMITYNHEKYIKEAIESILIQRTSFDYELILSNDNSPDNTHAIIEEILQNHPKRHLVRYICHKQNLGMMQNSIHNLENCKGKYIAFCEGDDAWTDPLKLETQISEMKKHPECDLSFHPAIVFSGKNKTNSIISLESRKTRIFSASEVIKGGGEFCPTASLIITKAALSKLPTSFNEGPVGDYFIQIIGSLRGGALYINKIMSLYRIHTDCSWNTSLNRLTNKTKFFEAYARSILKFDTFLKRKYSSEIHTEIRKHYKDISTLKLQQEGSEGFCSFYKRHKNFHKDTFEVKTLYYTGLLTKSAPILNSINRLFFIHPNIIRRFFKKMLIFNHLRQHKPPHMPQRSHANPEPCEVWLKN